MSSSLKFLDIFFDWMASVLFVCGSLRNCGKTSVSLGLLSYLLGEMKLNPEQIGYIKPCTQCINPTIVWKFCQEFGIECVGIGPVVFYPGFTAEFIDGEHKAENLLNQISDAVEKLKKNRKIVIVDGVGYPSVGSVCGVSNAQVAKKLNAPVILVNLVKDGSIGNSIDTLNQNLEYFKGFHVPVLGIISNKVPVTHYDRVVKYLGMFYEQNELKSLGFVKYMDDFQEEEIEEGCKYVSKKKLQISQEDKDKMKSVYEHFKECIDFEQIFKLAFAFGK